jgi:hypothetical protein
MILDVHVCAVAKGLETIFSRRRRVCITFLLTSTAISAYVDLSSSIADHSFCSSVFVTVAVGSDSLGTSIFRVKSNMSSPIGDEALRL